MFLKYKLRSEERLWDLWFSLPSQGSVTLDACALVLGLPFMFDSPLGSGPHISLCRRSRGLLTVQTPGQ
jgi:hypothetical protein